MAISTDFLPWLKQQIPLLQHMGISQLVYDGQKVCLSAALAPNINDKGTGFGGSLGALATLSGWCLMTLSLKERAIGEFDVVVRDSNIAYLAPVRDDFVCHVTLPNEAIWRQFEKRLMEKGSARLPLTITVHCGETVALRMESNYTAIRKSPVN